MPTLIPAFWAREQNFGDCLTEALLASYGLDCVHATPHFARVIGVGSILARVPAEYRGIVLGAGLLRERTRMRLPQANLLALRGPLSRERVAGSRPRVLGDPGLLAPRLLANRPPQRYRLGFVPHYVDQGNPLLVRLSRQHGDAFKVVNVRQPPAEVIAEIASCEAIVSSSLHGLIVADSLGIPSAWHLVAGVLGDGFKFRDYFGALGEQREPLHLHGGESLDDLLAQVQPAPATAGIVAAELHDVFRELPDHLQRVETSAVDQWRMYLSYRLQKLVGRRDAA